MYALPEVIRNHTYLKGVHMLEFFSFLKYANSLMQEEGRQVGRDQEEVSCEWAKWHVCGVESRVGSVHGVARVST